MVVFLFPQAVGTCIVLACGAKVAWLVLVMIDDLKELQNFVRVCVASI